MLGHSIRLLLDYLKFWDAPKTAPDRKLYIAISKVAYNTFFTQDVAQLILNKHQLPIIVVDIEAEEITQWIN